VSTIVGTNIEVTNIKFDSDTTSMIISNTGQITAQGEGTATTNVQSGLCKAWVRTYAAAVNITDSFNMSSVTDSAVGKYAPQINNNMANGNYAVCLGGDDKQDGGSVMVHNIDDSVDQATTGYGTSFKKYSYAITDNNQNAASMVLGDLA
jgi:roadblock/LC7 domain-containing protein